VIHWCLCLRLVRC